MASSSVTLSLDRRLLEHPRAYHLRRMRQGVWLYLDLLARLPAGAQALEVDPAAVGEAMGLPEGWVRSWLGHLRKAGYLDTERLNSTLRVTLKRVHEPTPAVQDRTPSRGTARRRFFAVRKLVDALGEQEGMEALAAALELYPDPVVKRALAGALAVPEGKIRRSRTALFLYLLKRHAHEP